MKSPDAPSNDTSVLAPPATNDALVGGVLAAAAYASWGLLPIYWKTLKSVSALEVLSHRVIWSAIFLALVLTATRRWPAVVPVLRSFRRLRILIATTVLLGINWGLFIWAILENHVLQSSLGYYINPLLNVAFGTIFLRERLSRLQLAAVVLAGVGVLSLTISQGEAPWVALALGFSFAGYALLRKISPEGAFVSLFVETLLATPVALAYIVWAEASGAGALGSQSTRVAALLVGSGIVTALPLLWFGNAARRLRLSTLGFFQYIAPTCQFLLAVFAFGEPITRAHAFAFGCIWIALALYSVNARLASISSRSA